MNEGCRMRSEDNTFVLSTCFQTCYCVGSLSNNVGDDNENGKKAIDLDWQNNNFGRSLRSKRFRASSSRTLGRERKKEEWRGRGRGEKVSYSPLPLPVQFFLLPLQLSRYNSTGNACYAGYFGRASRLFCTFLCNRCTTATWNCLISLFWRTWTQDNDFLGLFLNFDYEVHLVSEKFSNIWRIEQDTINKMKPEAVRTQFFSSDVFVTVAVPVA